MDTVFQNHLASEALDIKLFQMESFQLVAALP